MHFPSTLFFRPDGKQIHMGWYLFGTSRRRPIPEPADTFLYFSHIAEIPEFHMFYTVFLSSPLHYLEHFGMFIFIAFSYGFFAFYLILDTFYLILGAKTRTPTLQG